MITMAADHDFLIIGTVQFVFFISTGKPRFFNEQHVFLLVFFYPSTY